MSERESNFLKVLRNYLMVSGITLLLTATAFYYNTQNRLSNLETDVSKKADKELIETKLNNIQGSLDDLKVQLANKQEKTFTWGEK